MDSTDTACTVPGFEGVVPDCGEWHSCVFAAPSTNIVQSNTVQSELERMQAMLENSFFFKLISFKSSEIQVAVVF